ncbi:LysM peptidoglycan-binding domain-containing protein [Vibrio europaeus]|uniref:LysM peptidoglycan-binding domain-containing protein n=1 Tax=Vibrio europaeus TaxID=300876 RepID=UPI0023424F5D|nr:LysM domain-containing protein [Vibrio europaeus]MDC5841937.1 LysM peptidoglycan-binding domain-containing protein [Vibrio europaeus]
MPSYKIQPGDSLLQIAIDQRVEYIDILALNPQYQSNPDYIRAGDSIHLPTIEKVEEVKPDFSIEPPSNAIEPKPSGEIVCQSECKTKQLFDVLFVTGDAPADYYCLTEEHQSKLKEEIKYTDQLMQGYKELLENAPKEEEATANKMQEHALKKKAWLEQCIYAGAIAAQEPASNTGVATQPTNNAPITQHYIGSKITELEKRRVVVKNYVPFFSEQSALTVRDKVIEGIENEISDLKRLVNKPPTPESSSKQGINPNQFDAKTFERKPARRHVIEVWLASENRLVYLRAEFFESAKNNWIKNPEKTEVTKALEARDWQGLKQAIKTDITKGIGGDFKAGKLESVFANWKVDGWKAHEWKATQKLYDNNGEVLFAATEEAQLLRFAAQASVKSTIEPSKGKIDLGIGAEASFALAEGAVGLNCYLPYESGYTLELSYLDANKQQAVYPFGHFRAKVSLMLSCFVGAMTNGRLEISNQPNENPGHQILISPTVSMGTNTSGGVGVKGDIFGGAQIGGQVEGGLEWKAPPDIKLDKVFDFATLAKVGANGNIAVGAGAGWDFQLAIDRGQFVFNCSGRLVFGPGASGGFGTTIDFEQLWQLAVILFKGLKATDYRLLDNLDDDVYRHFMRSSYMAFASDVITSPEEALKQAVMNTSQSINDWWKERTRLWQIESEKEKEAFRLARRIVTKYNDVTGEVPFEELLPETVGIMLNTLVTTFYFSWEEKQETAIYILLLGAVKTWRRFEEVITRMNATGEKPSGGKQAEDKALFDNLARINAILDGEQQTSFNNWVLTLAKINEINENNFAQMRPFEPRSGWSWNQKRDRVERQIARLNKNNGYYI